MNQGNPWATLVAMIQGFALIAKTGPPQFTIELMLQIHSLQRWYNYSDPAMEEVLHDAEAFRWFADLDAVESRLPGETLVLRFRHFLEEFGLTKTIFATVNDSFRAKRLLLKSGSAVDATLIAAPRSTKNNGGMRDPELHQTKRGNQYHFGIKAHTGVFGDLSYRGIENRKEAKDIAVNWYITMTPDKRSELNLQTASGQFREVAERIKASIRAKVEHPFCIIKSQFGYTQALCRGLAKNPTRLHTLFALSNLWMARTHLLQEMAA